MRKDERLSISDQNKVLNDHVHRAIERLTSGEDATNFHDSRDYDVLLDDGLTRLAPKKVFGFALEEALGRRYLGGAARPKHFSSGWSVPSFKAIIRAGYRIVPKNEASSLSAKFPDDLPLEDGEEGSIEGSPRVVSHLKRERDRTLAKKKRAEFIAKNGKLYCEMCGLDPVEKYNHAAADVCIQVHHHETQLKDMMPGHETKLSDLQCLCANCHAFVHRKLSLGLVD